jgi:hypothetical protein
MCKYVPLSTRKNLMKVYLATNLWAWRVCWKAARPVPNWFHILGRCIELGTVGRPEAWHDFSISCPRNILPQCWGCTRVCVHLGAVCHVRILCCCCCIGFHCATGHIHLHLHTDTCLIWQSITGQCMCNFFRFAVRQHRAASWHV